MGHTTEDSGTDSNQEETQMNEQGFVHKDEFPACPECGSEEPPVIGRKPPRGRNWASLHCPDCGQVLRHLEGAITSVDEEDRHWASIGEGSWGTGDTKEEAVENMKEFLDEDASRWYTLWAGNRELQANRYGTVSAGKGSQVILDYQGRHKIREE